MSHLSASFSATIRVRLADSPGLVRAARAGDRRRGRLAGRDRPRPRRARSQGARRDGRRCRRRPPAARSSRRARAIDGVEVVHVSDRTFLMHLGGKLEVHGEVAAQDARRPLDGVHARAWHASARRSRDSPEAAWNLTIKQNTVAVVSDGTAVLGLGDIGPEAAMPVMEGKAMLFKEFGGIDAWPLCLETKDPDEIVAVVKAIAPGVRRHQPGGHLRAALLRDRGAATRGARHPGVPRRPARHRDRRARRARERARGRRASGSRTSRSCSPASAPPASP